MTDLQRYSQNFMYYSFLISIHSTPCFTADLPCRDLWRHGLQCGERFWLMPCIYILLELGAMKKLFGVTALIPLYYAHKWGTLLLFCSATRDSWYFFVYFHLVRVTSFRIMERDARCLVVPFYIYCDQLTPSPPTKRGVSRFFLPKKLYMLGRRVCDLASL